jgi:hypothetical protein
MKSVTGEDPLEKLPQTAQMRQDLQDLARRDALRTEYKQGLPTFYPDIRDELQLTPQEEDRLFELLADFQMQHLDIFYSETPGGPSVRMSRFQENDRRRDGALLSLLGAELLERYRRYQMTLPERQFVAWFAGRLDPADALSSEQKSQLMAVAKAARERPQDLRHEQALQRMLALGPGRSPAELREANIKINEDALPELEAQSQRLLHQLASFLTASQLATLEQLEREKHDAQRRWLDSLRTDEGSANLVVTDHGVMITARDMAGPSSGKR